jgi:hypothetical protein
LRARGYHVFSTFSFLPYNLRHPSYNLIYYKAAQASAARAKLWRTEACMGDMGKKAAGASSLTAQIAAQIAEEEAAEAAAEAKAKAEAAALAAGVAAAVAAAPVPPVEGNKPSRSRSSSNVGGCVCGEGGASGVGTLSKKRSSRLQQQQQQQNHFKEEPNSWVFEAKEWAPKAVKWGQDVQELYGHTTTSVMLDDIKLSTRRLKLDHVPKGNIGRFFIFFCIFFFYN